MAVSNKQVQGKNKVDKRTESNGKEGNWYLCRVIRAGVWGSGYGVKICTKKEGVRWEFLRIELSQ